MLTNNYLKPSDSGVYLYETDLYNDYRHGFQPHKLKQPIQQK